MARCKDVDICSSASRTASTSSNALGCEPMRAASSSTVSDCAAGGVVEVVADLSAIDSVTAPGLRAQVVADRGGGSAIDLGGGAGLGAQLLAGFGSASGGALSASLSAAVERGSEGRDVAGRRRLVTGLRHDRGAEPGQLGGDGPEVGGRDRLDLAAHSRSSAVSGAIAPALDCDDRDSTALSASVMARASVRPSTTCSASSATERRSCVMPRAASPSSRWAVRCSWVWAIDSASWVARCSRPSRVVSRPACTDRATDARMAPTAAVRVSAAVVTRSSAEGLFIGGLLRGVIGPVRSRRQAADRLAQASEALLHVVEGGRAGDQLHQLALHLLHATAEHATAPGGLAGRRALLGERGGLRVVEPGEPLVAGLGELREPGQHLGDEGQVAPHLAAGRHQPFDLGVTGATAVLMPGGRIRQRTDVLADRGSGLGHRGQDVLGSIALAKGVEGRGERRGQGRRGRQRGDPLPRAGPVGTRGRSGRVAGMAPTSSPRPRSLSPNRCEVAAGMASKRSASDAASVSSWASTRARSARTSASSKAGRLASPGAQRPARPRRPAAGAARGSSSAAIRRNIAVDLRGQRCQVGGGERGPRAQRPEVVGDRLQVGGGALFIRLGGGRRCRRRGVRGRWLGACRFCWRTAATLAMSGPRSVVGKRVEALMQRPELLDDRLQGDDRERSDALVERPEVVDDGPQVVGGVRRSAGGAWRGSRRRVRGRWSGALRCRVWSDRTSSTTGWRLVVGRLFDPLRRRVAMLAMRGARSVVGTSQSAGAG